LNRNGESTHLEQYLQVSGHDSFTPSSAHLKFVDFAATHLQFLVILLSFWSVILSRNVESAQLLVTIFGAAVGCFAGDIVGNIAGDCVGIDVVE
jgi:hypothetical protein